MPEFCLNEIYIQFCAKKSHFFVIKSPMIISRRSIRYIEALTNNMMIKGNIISYNYYAIEKRLLTKYIKIKCFWFKNPNKLEIYHHIEQTNIYIDAFIIRIRIILFAVIWFAITI